jgi:hypothetical protein
MTMPKSQSDYVVSLQFGFQKFRACESAWKDLQEELDQLVEQLSLLYLPGKPGTVTIRMSNDQHWCCHEEINNDTLHHVVSVVVGVTVEQQAPPERIHSAPLFYVHASGTKGYPFRFYSLGNGPHIFTEARDRRGLSRAIQGVVASYDAGEAICLLQRTLLAEHREE